MAGGGVHFGSRASVFQSRDRAWRGGESGEDRRGDRQAVAKAVCGAVGRVVERSHGARVSHLAIELGRFRAEGAVRDVNFFEETVPTEVVGCIMPWVQNLFFGLT